MILPLFTNLILITYCVLSVGISVSLDLSNVKTERYETGDTVMYECKKLAASCPNIVALYTKKTVPPLYSVYIRANTTFEQNHPITDPRPEILFAQIEHDYYFDKLGE